MRKSTSGPAVRWAPLPSRSLHSVWAPLYFGAYLAYLFWHQESELQHWLTLVLVPTLLLHWAHRSSGRGWRDALASLGLRPDSRLRGLAVAILLGAAIGIFQTLASRNADQVVEAFQSGRALWLFPLAFLLMMVTAGFTEELFFRGFLQTRLEGLFRSRIAGLLVASFCFGVYHLPYAYLNPNWPSAGDWDAAWQAALGQGVPAGLILGALYLYSGRNLLAPVVLHALINAFPAMAFLKFGSG